MRQRLQDHAVLLGLLAKRPELLRRRRRRGHVETHADLLDPAGYLARDAERAPKVEVAVDLDVDALGRDPERRRDELARDLGARGERSEKEVAGAGRRSRPAGPGVRL